MPRLQRGFQCLIFHLHLPSPTGDFRRVHLSGSAVGFAKHQPQRSLAQEIPFWR